MGPSKFVTGKRICFQSFFSQNCSVNWEHFTFQGTIFRCYIIPHNKAQTFSWTNKTKKKLLFFFSVLFCLEGCFNIFWLLCFAWYAGSSWFARPQRVSGSWRSACKYNPSITPSLLIRRFLSLERLSLLSAVCRASLELMGKLVLKETWWGFLLLKFCSFLVGETVKIRLAGRSLKN